jgi:biopolymer transport protein ExbB
MLLLIGGVEWFTKGGWVMWPIALLSVYMVFVIINRATYFITTIPQLNRELESILRGMSLLPERLAGELAPLLARGVKEGEVNKHRADLAVEHELLGASRLLNSLDTVAMVAPMLGLLGTVTGMVQTFQKVADMQGQVNPSVLAGGIWEALLTTVFGLIVGIPALMGYRYFRSRLIRWENHLYTVVDDAAQLAQEPPRRHE